MRALLKSELALIAGGSTVEEVLVIGHHVDGGTGTLVSIYDSGYTAYEFSGSSPPSSPDYVSGDKLVHVSVTNSANLAGAQTAAAHLANAIQQLDPLIKGLSDTTQIHMPDGHVVSGATVKSDWAQAEFKVTDDVAFNNGGVGQVTGHMDTISYTALTGSGSYGDPSYPNDSGLVFIVLHELEHMTQMGRDSNTLNYNDYNADTVEKSLNPQFTNSWFWTNNERLADDFAHSVSSMLGTNTALIEQQVGSAGIGFGASDPNQRLADDMGY